MLWRAISIAAKAYEDIYDRWGQPYILHCIKVMNNTDWWPIIKAAAVLHDIVEDGLVTFQYLEDQGILFPVRELIDKLTKRDWETYEDYIYRLSVDEQSIRIKLADLRDNSDITRLKGMREKDFKRILKYHEAYIKLEKSLNDICNNRD